MLCIVSIVLDGDDRQKQFVLKTRSDGSFCRFRSEIFSFDRENQVRKEGVRFSKAKSHCSIKMSRWEKPVTVVSKLLKGYFDFRGNDVRVQ